MSNNQPFYDKNKVILNEFKHLKTPLSILYTLDNFGKPEDKIKNNDTTLTISMIFV